ncbi:hypothetical protein [Rouxiella sp. Mn2063]|uniref:hypothetical protein n=1 Tax=Rouxiella sp. Mn2063 TaxID=3395262 RepID=UPI003BC94DBC
MHPQYTLHRLSLLQQWRFDSFRLLFCIALMLLFSVIIIWVLPLFSHGNVHGAIIGVLCGLTINFWLTCIARLRINAPVNAEKLLSILEGYQYRKTPQGYYDLQVHRYTKFTSQRIFLQKQDKTWVVTGPHNILKKIIKQVDLASFSDKD